MIPAEVDRQCTDPAGGSDDGGREDQGRAGTRMGSQEARPRLKADLPTAELTGGPWVPGGPAAPVIPSAP